MVHEKIVLKGEELLRLIGRTTFIVVITIFIILLIFHLLFLGRIYPGITISGISFGGKTPNQALKTLEGVNPPTMLSIKAGERKFVLNSPDIELQYDYPKTINQALAFGRQDDIFENQMSVIKAIRENPNLPLVFTLNEEKLNTFASSLARELETPAIPPKITIEKGAVIIEKGGEGKAIDEYQLKQVIYNHFARAKSEEIVVPFIIIKTLTDKEVEKLRERAKKFLGAKLILNLKDDSLIIKDNELVSLLTPDGNFKEEGVREIIDKTTTRFEQSVQNATFRFEGGRVVEFTPAKDGISVKKDELKQAIFNSLTEAENGEKEAKVNIPVITTSPTIVTGEVNNLGIRELVGRGTSHFKGSIPSRIYNIQLAASRLNGIIIPPGEIFSFNSALGDVSAFTGYQQAYIIKDGKTVLGDGGGVCQVSTTFFRAALASGLPIIERRAHSYRVYYYEQDSGPGLDATVYSPTTDLKIKNDTPAHILIQAWVDRKNMTLTFEFYGTNDGRIATTTKPRVWDVVEPLPDLYQDDPSLPAGAIKQIDFKAWGAKSAFEYKVVRDNEILQNRTFYSVYQPWQAVYLRGIAPQ